MNNRRKLVIALGAGALAGPFGSFAQQQGKVWRVGFLTASSRPASLDSDFYGVFRQEMRELAYIEGKNLVIEWRFAEGKHERLPGMAVELVQLKMDVIVAVGAPAISAAQKATATIPIVMGNTGDPVGTGFVKSLAHPGGNITGVTNINAELSPKLLELLLSMAPKLSRVAILMNPAIPSHATVLENVQAAAQKTNVKILPVKARTPQAIENAFSIMTRENAEALIVVFEAFFVSQQRQIAELAAKHRLPSITATRAYVEAGGLMSYGPNNGDQYRRTAAYVDKIFKGAKPSDLPVQQPTKFELFINGKTAKALGLTIPQSLLTMADKVIE
jgi:putative ABC transport system substrate-binding protein